MADDDDGFQQQCDGPHAEQPLKDHETDECHRHAPRLLRVAPIAPSDRGQRDANQA
jgi:hypothetical protein